MDTALATSPSSAISFISSEDTNILFGKCSEKVRIQVMDKIAAMQSIDGLIVSGLNQKQAIKDVANRYRGKSGFSGSKLTKDYALWVKGGQKPNSRGLKSGMYYEPRDWKMFVPAWNNGKPDTALNNEEFVTYVRELFSATTREDATGNALHSRILDDWFNGKEVPGYGNIYRFCAENGIALPKDKIRRSGHYPRGWSVDNIRKMIPRSKAHRVLIQRGEHAAHDHWGDQLLRDRSKLKPFELITFDDVRCDIRVIMELPGKQAQIVYPEAVFALDVSTGLILAKGVVGNYVRAEDADGGKAGTKRGIQQADTRFLLQSILERFGLPVGWQMNLLLENASASLSSTDQAMFERLTGMRIENTGLIHRKLLKSGFMEQGGQPWAKGWIESYFRLLHTTTNHLPGTVGRRYDLTNGSADAEAKYALKTCREALKQGHSINDLKLPLLTLNQYHELLDEYVTRLNWRTDHSLQGFDKVYEVEIQPGVWMRHNDPLAIPYINNNTVFKTRLEAPAERFQRLMKGQKMAPAHPRQLMAIGMEKKPVTVLKGKVTINRSGQDNLQFFDAESAPKLDRYNSRNKALVGFIAADKSCIHLFSNDSDLHYVASPRNIERVVATDQEAILVRAGEVDRSRNRIRDDVSALMEPQNQQYAAMREHNSTLLESAAKAEEVSSAIIETTAERQRTEQTKKRLVKAKKADLDAILASNDDAGEEDEGLSLTDLM